MVVLVTLFAEVSGAHFNPAVTLAFTIKRELRPGIAAAYVVAQLVGAVLGVWAAHLMFAEAVIQISTKLREGPAQGFSEFVATFGLVATILGALRFRPDFTPIAVGLYITAAYWFTASTSCGPASHRGFLHLGFWHCIATRVTRGCDARHWAYTPGGGGAHASDAAKCHITNTQLPRCGARFRAHGNFRKKNPKWFAPVTTPVPWSASHAWAACVVS